MPTNATQNLETIESPDNTQTFTTSEGVYDVNNYNPTHYRSRCPGCGDTKITSECPGRLDRICPRCNRLVGVTRVRKRHQVASDGGTTQHDTKAGDPELVDDFQHLHERATTIRDYAYDDVGEPHHVVMRIHLATTSLESLADSPTLGSTSAARRILERVTDELEAAADAAEHTTVIDDTLDLIGEIDDLLRGDTIPEVATDGGQPITDDIDDDTIVYRAARNRGPLHTTEDCPNLVDCKNTISHPRSAFPDDYPICHFCQNGHSSQGHGKAVSNGHAIRRAVEAMDPEDLATDGGVDYHTKGTQIDDNRLLDALQVAYENGDVDAMDGGVHSSTLADRLPFAQSTIADHLNDLANQGRLKRVWGVDPTDPKVPRRSYAPTGGDGQ